MGTTQKSGDEPGDESRDESSAELAERIAALETAVDELQAENERLREENEELRDRVDELEQRSHVEWDSGNAEDAWLVNSEGKRYPLGRALEARPRENKVESMIDDVLHEAQIETDDAREEQQTRLKVKPETPLEQLAACPEQIQRGACDRVDTFRATKFAEELYTRTTATPRDGERVVSAGDLSRWLASHTDCKTNATGSRAHSQTLDRVIHALDDLGVDHVSVREAGGRGSERKVAVDAEFADRCQQFGSADLDADVVNELNAAETNHEAVTT